MGFPALRYIISDNPSLTYEVISPSDIPEQDYQKMSQIAWNHHIDEKNSPSILE